MMHPATRFIVVKEQGSSRRSCAPFVQIENLRIRLWNFKKLDIYFREMLGILDMIYCLHVDNSGQMNIPTYIDEILNGHVVQTFAKMDAL